MSWILDEQRRMLRDSAQAFVSERLPVSHLRALRDAAAGSHDAGRWREFGAQGYAATLVPEPHGGLGLGVCEAGLIAEQLGHTLAPTPFFSTAVLAARLLTRGGSAAQQQWLPRIAAADGVLALALDEGPKHRPQAAMATTARREGEGWRIDGAKQFVVDGAAADAWIVAAQAGDDVALLLVPAGTPGASVEACTLLDAHGAARLRLADVRVGAEALIGTLAQGRGLLDDALEVGRAVLASELLGLADEVFTRTLDYLRQRRQFDRIIGEFQALQHRAAELFCDLELARALTRDAQAALDRGAADAPLRVAQAKARAALSANRAVQEGVQMHGGIGMTDELDIGLFMKRARVLQELLGDANFHLDRVALLSGY